MKDRTMRMLWAILLFLKKITLDESESLIVRIKSWRIKFQEYCLFSRKSRFHGILLKLDFPPLIIKLPNFVHLS